MIGDEQNIDTSVSKLPSQYTWDFSRNKSSTLHSNYPRHSYRHDGQRRLRDIFKGLSLLFGEGQWKDKPVCFVNTTSRTYQERCLPLSQLLIANERVSFRHQESGDFSKTLTELAIAGTMEGLSDVELGKNLLSKLEEMSFKDLTTLDSTWKPKPVCFENIIDASQGEKCVSLSEFLGVLEVDKPNERMAEECAPWDVNCLPHGGNGFDSGSSSGSGFNPGSSGSSSNRPPSYYDDHHWGESQWHGSHHDRHQQANHRHSHNPSRWPSNPRPPAWADMPPCAPYTKTCDRNIKFCKRACLPNSQRWQPISGGMTFYKGYIKYQVPEEFYPQAQSWTPCRADCHPGNYYKKIFYPYDYNDGRYGTSINQFPCGEDSNSCSSSMKYCNSPCLADRRTWSPIGFSRQIQRNGRTYLVPKDYYPAAQKWPICSFYCHPGFLYKRLYQSRVGESSELPPAPCSIGSLPTPEPQQKQCEDIYCVPNKAKYKIITDSYKIIVSDTEVEIPAYWSPYYDYTLCPPDCSPDPLVYSIRPESTRFVEAASEEPNVDEYSAHHSDSHESHEHNDAKTLFDQDLDARRTSLTHNALMHLEEIKHLLTSCSDFTLDQYSSAVLANAIGIYENSGTESVVPSCLRDIQSSIWTLRSDNTKQSSTSCALLNLFTDMIAKHLASGTLISESQSISSICGQLTHYLPKNTIYSTFSDSAPHEFDEKLMQNDYSLLDKMLEESAVNLPAELLDTQRSILSALKSLGKERHGEILDAVTFSLTMSLLSSLLESIFTDLDLPTIIDTPSSNRTKSRFYVQQAVDMYSEFIVINQFLSTIDNSELTTTAIRQLGSFETKPINPYQLLFYLTGKDYALEPSPSATLGTDTSVTEALRSLRDRCQINEKIDAETDLLNHEDLHLDKGVTMIALITVILRSAALCNLTEESELQFRDMYSWYRQLEIMISASAGVYQYLALPGH